VLDTNHVSELGYAEVTAREGRWPASMLVIRLTRMIAGKS
jgi:hypothetical protein